MEAVVFFGLHERAFNRLFSPSVNASALLRFGQGSDFVRSILPDMSLHPPSRHTRSKARCPSRTGFTGFAVAEYWHSHRGWRSSSRDASASGRCKRRSRGASEAAFAVALRPVGVPLVADDALDSLLFQQMGDSCAVASRVQSHGLRQLSQPHLDFVGDFRKRSDVVDVGRFDVDVDVAPAVHRPVFAVMKAFRLCWPLSGSVVLCIRPAVPPPR